MLTSFKYFNENFNIRLEIANYYYKKLSSYVKCPQPNKNKDIQCTFFDYTIISENRDKLQKSLSKKGIETKIKHSKLMTQQPAYKSLTKSNLPQAEYLVNRILSLPIHEKLTQNDLDYIVESIREFYEK